MKPYILLGAAALLLAATAAVAKPLSQDAALASAFDKVCRPILEEYKDEAEVARAAGLTAEQPHDYAIGAGVRVRVGPLGMMRGCTILVEAEDVDAVRAAVAKAAKRWGLERREGKTETYCSAPEQPYQFWLVQSQPGARLISIPIRMMASKPAACMN